MIQKSTIVKPVDNCGVIKARVFHLYKGSNGRFAFSGDFIKVSAREVQPENPIKKKSKHVSILIKSRCIENRIDGSFIRFKKNGVVLLKKRLTPKGRSLKGPVSKRVRRERFISSFSKKI
jgi:ribosomal protein L14